MRISQRGGATGFYVNEPKREDDIKKQEEDEEDEDPLPVSVSYNSITSVSVLQFSRPSSHSKLCVVLGTVVGAVVVAPKVVTKNVGASGVVGGAGLVRSGMKKINICQI